MKFIVVLTVLFSTLNFALATGPRPARPNLSGLSQSQIQQTGSAYLISLLQSADILAYRSDYSLSAPVIASIEDRATINHYKAIAVANLGVNSIEQFYMNSLAHTSNGQIGSRHVTQSDITCRLFDNKIKAVFEAIDWNVDDQETAALKMVNHQYSSLVQDPRGIRDIELNFECQVRNVSCDVHVISISLRVGHQSNADNGVWSMSSSDGSNCGSE